MKNITIIISMSILFLSFLMCTNPYEYEDRYHIPDLDASELDSVQEGIGLINIEVDNTELITLLKNSSKHGPEWKIPCKVKAVFGSEIFHRIGDLKIHGGISRKYSKKSFRLYFNNDPIKSKNIFKNFSNRENHSNEFSELVLNGNSIDFSNIRNYLSMHISSQLGATTPRLGFVRLVINQKYFGLYTVIERINSKMVHKLLNHSNFDLIKSSNHNGNLKTANDMDTTTNHCPTEGFELKCGNWNNLIDFVVWLESEDYSYDRLSNRLTESALFGYCLGYYFCGVEDSYSKNFYIVFDNKKNKIDLIHWDSDASFGRAWDGRLLDESTLICHPTHNGVFNKVIKNRKWNKKMEKQFLKSFDSFLCENKLLKKIDNLEELLKYEAINDLHVWASILSEDFKNDYWGLNSSSPEEIWSNEIKLIRDFIKKREDFICEYFNND